MSSTIEPTAHEGTNSELLASPGPPVTATPLDFNTTALSTYYSGTFALVLDNLLSPSECASLLTSAGNNWQTLSTSSSFRECSRIKAYSPDWSAALYTRLLPHLPPAIQILTRKSATATEIAGPAALKGREGSRAAAWVLKGVNPRPSFLRYQPGDHFRAHCDSMSTHEVEAEPESNSHGGSEGPRKRMRKSFVTVQIYLSDAMHGAGGATRFWAPREGKGRKGREGEGEGADEAGDGDEEPHVDVSPATGRALVFQQRRLWHSGEEVRRGEKYAVRLDLMYEREFR